MSIQYVRIKHFRSIFDTGNLYLDNNLTVLAGKNESGKSNILKALDSFSKNTFVEEDLPEGFHNGSFEDVVDVPEVTVRLDFDLIDIKGKLIFSETFSNKFDFKFETDEILNLTITRYGGRIPQNVSGSLFEYVFKKDFDFIREELDDLLSTLSMAKKHVPFLDTSGIKECLSLFPFEIHYNLFDITDYLYHIVNDIEMFLEDENNVSNSLKNVLKKIRKLEMYVNGVLEDIRELCNIFVPEFVLFDSFDDILPDIVNDKNMNSPIVERFCKVVGINLEEFFKIEGLMRKRLTNKLSANISGEFGTYFNQHEVKLELSLDGDNLYFYIYDDNSNYAFRPGQRSKGFQWFLSFFLTLKAETTNDYILLIDEPGPYLHAKAQEDVLKILDNLSKTNQIVMTTHSPYLIDSSRLERVRLVLKNENGNTYIENKIHKGADKDTLTPVITSIGLDLSRDLVFSRNGVNILVEGISDYYYLEALKKKVEIPGVNDFCFIPNVGATQIPNLAVLLIGWGFDFLVILDNDSEGKKVQKTLLNKLFIKQDKIIFINSTENCSIEDLFSIRDFDKFVLCEEKPGENKEKNSKRANSGKALLAKKFNEFCHSDDSTLDFEDETINNFTELFIKLSSVISNEKTLLINKD